MNFIPDSTPVLALINADGTAVLGNRVWFDVARTIDGGAVLMTVTPVAPFMAPLLAEMTALPPATALARPDAVIATTEGVADDQLTWLVMSCVEPSLYLPEAWNCCVLPALIEVLAGVMLMELNIGAGWVVKTVIAAVPGDATYVAGTVNVSWLLDTNLVAWSAPFQRTTEFDVNPDPVTTIVNGCVPACTDAGEIELMVGALVCAQHAAAMIMKAATSERDLLSTPCILGEVSA